MKVKNILIAVIGAIVVGVLLGCIIAFFLGAFDKTVIPEDSLPEVTSSIDDTSSAVDEEERQAKEDRAKAKKAIEEAKKQDAVKENESKDSKKTAKKATDNTAQSNTTNQNTQAPAQQQQQPQTAQPQAQGNATINVQGADLNLRAAADPSSTIIGSVSNGTSVTVLERANGMVHIQTPNGSNAWVAEGFVNG